MPSEILPTGHGSLADEAPPADVSPPEVLKTLPTEGLVLPDEVRGAHVARRDSSGGTLRRAHARRGDPLLSVENRAMRARHPAASEEAPRGAHVSAGDPLLSLEHRSLHARHREELEERPFGAHVMEGDPLLGVERRALHAMRAEVVAPPGVFGSDIGTVPRPDAADPLEEDPREAEIVEPGADAPDPPVEALIPTGSDGHATRRAALATKRERARRTARRRRRRLVPAAGAAGAIAVGLSGGGAFAFIISHGSGSSEITAGSPVSVAVIATTGRADLLPGRAGAASFTLHNANSTAVTFAQVAPGATVVSDNTQLCASSFVSIAQALPYAMPTEVTVNPGGTSGVQSIANLVTLAPNAPSTCQGVAFTVTLTLSGQVS